jgi:hypothetical protein
MLSDITYWILAIENNLKKIFIIIRIVSTTRYNKMIMKKTKKIGLQNGSGRVREFFKRIKRIFKRKPVSNKPVIPNLEQVPNKPVMRYEEPPVRKHITGPIKRYRTITTNSGPKYERIEIPELKEQHSNSRLRRATRKIGEIATSAIGRATSAFGRATSALGKKLTRKRSTVEKTQPRQIHINKLLFNTIKSKIDRLIVNKHFNNSYKQTLTDIYEYYIEIKLLPKLDDKIKFISLILNKRPFTEDIHPEFVSLINGKGGSLRFFIEILLDKIKVIDKFIEESLFNDSSRKIEQEPSSRTENVYINDNPNPLNITDKNFIEETTDKILEQINPTYANTENMESLLPFLENHNEFKNAMLTYYSCLKNPNNQPCTLGITKEQRKSYVTTLQEYIQNPEKAMKEYEEYQPLQRTPEEQAQIAAYMELLGKPQFDSSTNEENTSL